MELKTRTTREFIEIKIDEIEVTIFNDRKKEIEDLIRNLIQVAGELSECIEIPLVEFIDDDVF